MYTPEKESSFHERREPYQPPVKPELFRAIKRDIAALAALPDAYKIGWNRHGGLNQEGRGVVLANAWKYRLDRDVKVPEQVEFAVYTAPGERILTRKISREPAQTTAHISFVKDGSDSYANGDIWLLDSHEIEYHVECFSRQKDADEEREMEAFMTKLGLGSEWVAYSYHPHQSRMEAHSFMNDQMAAELRQGIAELVDHP